MMGKHHFPVGLDPRLIPGDYSVDAIIYVVVVVVFYAAIIILLLTTNFHRRRGDGDSNIQNSFPIRKHWLFFNPINGEAQQATRKESQHYIHRQDAETV